MTADPMGRSVGEWWASLTPTEAVRGGSERNQVLRPACVRSLSRKVISRLERRGWDLNPRSALRRTTVFKTAAFDRSATPPRHRLRCSAERCLRGRKGPPAKRLTGVNLVRGFKSLPLRLLGALPLKGQRALRAAHPIPWDTLTLSVNARTAAHTAPERACTAPAEEDPQPPSRRVR